MVLKKTLMQKGIGILASCTITCEYKCQNEAVDESATASVLTKEGKYVIKHSPNSN